MTRSRILAVDDDALNRTILEELLSEDHDLTLASSGEEALKKAAETNPDLVLLDIMMPGLDGYEVCRRLRADPVLRYCKIILVSAKAMVSERLKGYEVGADDYVTKPFDHDELLAKVKVFLRLRNLEEIDREKTDFLTLFNHEARTPLSLVQGALEFLSSEEDLEAGTGRKLGEMALNGAERLRDMLEEASLFFRIRSGRLQPSMTRLDLPKLAEAAIQLRSRRANRTGLRLTVEAQPGIALAGDQDLVVSLLGSMIDQAMNARQPGENVVVRLTAAERAVELAARARGREQIVRDLSEVADPLRVRDLEHHGGQINLRIPLMRELVGLCGGQLTAEPAGGDEVMLRVNLPSPAMPA